MIIYGLLQNMWVNEPHRMEAVLRQHPGKHRQVIGALLCMGTSLTGKRLRCAFGSAMNDIEWDNACGLQIGGRSSACFSPDRDHVARALDELRPDVVLVFGSVARLVMQDRRFEAWLIHGPHPAARQHGVRRRLGEMARTLARHKEPLTGASV